jgi:periplasmic divalent cation tolerance protein
MAKSNARFALALVTAPDVKTARRLARAALKARLAACANLVPRVESHYWWQGQIQKGTEVLMLFKTTVHLLPALEQAILEAHPYDTPEFVALEINKGNSRYLRWCQQSVRK